MAGKVGRETYPLKHLLPPDILQPPIQLPDLADHIIDLPFILTLDLTRLPNGHVDLQLDPSQHIPLPAAEPAVDVDRGGPAGRETQSMQTGVGGAEGELGGDGGGVGRLGNDSVVVVEGFFHGEVDLEFGGVGELLGLGGEGFGAVGS